MSWKTQWKWWVPLPVLALLPFCSEWDLRLARYFYDGQNWMHHPLAHFLYRHGEWTGKVVSAIALAVWLGSYSWKRLASWRYEAKIFFLSACLGAGLIVNAGCKTHLGRPRPRQLIEFGGMYSYYPPGRFNFDSERSTQASFPSGHVAMGSSYLALALTPTRRRWLPPLGWSLSLFWGGGLMIARMIQGGHFLSDVLVAPCVVWWSTLIVIFFFPPASDVTKKLGKLRDIPSLIQKKAMGSSVVTHIIHKLQKRP